jgi:hypothetical protein
MTDYLDRLERQLIEAVPRPAANPGVRRPAEAAGSRRPARGRGTGRRGIPLALIAAAALFAATAGALALTGVLATGPAVRPTRGLSPTTGLGVPARGGSRLLALIAPDPAGGLPWGMRLVHTTRDLVCVQIGRLQNGELGLLGRDGAFGDDGRFHPLPADAIGRELGLGSPARSQNCRPPGLLSSLEIVGIPESGLGGRSAERTMSARTVGSAERRAIAFGLLGPHARSVTYRLAGHSHTIAVEPGTGAYLIVLPDRRRRAAVEGEEAGGTVGEGAIGPAGPGPMTAATYRFGSTLCRETNRAPAPHEATAPGAPGTCPGPRFRRVPPPSRNLHRPVRVRLFRSSARGGEGAVVAFTAPYRVANALSGYSIQVPDPCHDGTTGMPIERDVKAGEVVRARFTEIFANACGHTVELEAVYAVYGGGGAPGFFGRRREIIVGQTTIERPR